MSRHFGTHAAEASTGRSKEWVVLGIGVTTMSLAVTAVVTFYCVSCMAPAFN